MSISLPFPQEEYLIDLEDLIIIQLNNLKANKRLNNQHQSIKNKIKQNNLSILQEEEIEVGKKNKQNKIIVINNQSHHNNSPFLLNNSLISQQRMDLDKEELKYLQMKSNLKHQKLKSQPMKFNQSKSQLNYKEEEIEEIIN